PAEAAERRLVVRPRQQGDALVMLPLGLRLEIQARLVLEVNRVEPLELDRPRLGRLTRQPDRPLAVRGWVVDAADQVPGKGAPVVRRADARGPLPGRVARVVARGVVLDAQPVDGATPPTDPGLAPDRHAGGLAGPGVPTLAVRAHALDRAALAQLEVELHAA